MEAVSSEALLLVWPHFKELLCPGGWRGYSLYLLYRDVPLDRAGADLGN